MARPERGPQEAIDRLFHALGEPTRRRMIEMLSERPHSVSALSEPLGITLTAISQHLRILEDAGLVRTEKLGRTRSCQIDPAGLSHLQKWTSDRRSLWERRLDTLLDILSDDEIPDKN
jgi:DNA-binding transcriptional ArsR family regulator